MVGLPGFEPGTSASRSEPCPNSPVLVIARIVSKNQVKGPLLQFSGGPVRTANTVVLHRSAPFPRHFTRLRCADHPKIRYVHLRALMYNMYMSVTEPLNITEARKRLAAIIDHAHTEHEPVYLTRRGRRVAAVIDADDLEGILELAEDMADIRAAEAARAEMKATGAEPIPWDEVKADLGLV
jgi:prevent-host-death family protein